MTNGQMLYCAFMVLGSTIMMNMKQYDLAVAWLSLLSMFYVHTICKAIKEKQL